MTDQRIMQFFGVRTSGSLAFQLFERWKDVLGIPGAVLHGVDLPLGGPLSSYRAAVARLKEDAAVRGALVTSHKLSVVRAAEDMIDRFTPEARLSAEVSALYKRGGALWGHACDPTNCGLAMQHFMGADYWRRHPDAAILSLGGGGATVALLVHLLTQARWRPDAVCIVDKREDILAHCRSVVNQFCDSGMRVALKHTTEAAQNDLLLAGMPAHSLVINATGMGKDLPGSPLTDAALFPERASVWELNYRGERLFLQQARSQAARRDLRVEDGWRYFLRGWSSVMSYVFDVPVTKEIFAQFAEISAAMR